MYLIKSKFLTYAMARIEFNNKPSKATAVSLATKLNKLLECQTNLKAIIVDSDNFKCYLIIN